MQENFRTAISNLFKTRDELSFRNIRGHLWPVLLIFPLSVIKGNLRFYDTGIALRGFEADTLLFAALGFGWLIIALSPKKMILPILRLSAVLSLALLPILYFTPLGSNRDFFYLGLKLLNGIAAAGSFYLFCFFLNNIERLVGLALIQFYYAVYYSTWLAFPVIHALGNAWGEIVITFMFLASIFIGRLETQEISTDNNSKGTGLALVFVLDVLHYMIMCMTNYIEWSDNTVSTLAFGIGTLTSIGVISFLQFHKGRSALYIWFLFLAFTMLGLGALHIDAPVAFFSGSFAYGLGDGFGYIMIYYICAGAIKRSKSLTMFRLYCLLFFAKYMVISQLFTFYFNNFQSPNIFLAFAVVFVLVCLCLFFMPLIQKRVFEADWTDGLYLRDIAEYSKPLAEAEEINAGKNLGLTTREEEIFTLLLTGASVKEIGYTLNIKFDTVRFHQKNLYRKLEVQSIAELFARYHQTNNTENHPETS